MRESSTRKQADGFERARLKSFWNKILALVTRQDDHLVSWTQAHQALHVEGHSARRLESVSVEHIVGTVGRYEDFDRAFLPTHDGLAPRWKSIEQAHDTGKSLPPISLYKVGQAYFCVDGHHRVSVARQRGIHHLEAEVIEVRANVPVSEHLDAVELEIKGEYIRFLERTRLDEHRPGQQIEFTIQGGYERLLEHIMLHVPERAGQAPALPPAEAVCDWYDHVYLPLVQLIREQNILEGFAKRSEADLYLWLVDHQSELRAQCGPEVNPERAAEHYADRHGGHLLTRATSALRDWLSQDACEWVTTDSTDA